MAKKTKTRKNKKFLVSQKQEVSVKTKKKAKAKPKAKPKKTVKLKKPKQTVREKKEEVSIRVVNIVVSSSLEQDIPLEKMAATLSNTEYNPEQFPGLVIRIKEPKTSALIFSSGKIVCTGARSLEDVERSIEKIIKSLKKINIDIKIKPKITIQNIVAAGSIGMDLNLNSLAIKLPNTEYEPEQFPGLVYKPKGDTRATFLLFTNGKVVCTGTKTEEDVHKALAKLIETLKNIK
ncbi:MAG: TATA-box-binding protein [Nanoarchaeota archaeon]|nr:TATA-box-binding protein [Nanoarchaeota archaeon]